MSKCHCLRLVPVTGNCGLQVRAGPWLVSLPLPALGMSADDADMDIDGPAPSAADSPYDPTGDALQRAVQVLQSVEGFPCSARILTSPCRPSKSNPSDQLQCVESPTLANRAQGLDLPMTEATTVVAVEAIRAKILPSSADQPALVPHGATTTSHDAFIGSPRFKALGRSEPHTLIAAHGASPGISSTPPTPLAGDQPHFVSGPALATQDGASTNALSADPGRQQWGSRPSSALLTENLVLRPAPDEAFAVAAADVSVASGPGAQLTPLCSYQRLTIEGTASGNTGGQISGPAGTGLVQPERDVNMTTSDAFIYTSSTIKDCDELPSTADVADVTMATRSAFATINDMFADPWDSLHVNAAEPTLTMATRDAFAAINSMFQDRTTTSRSVSALPFSACTAGPSCNSAAPPLCTSQSLVSPNAVPGVTMSSQTSTSPTLLRGSSLPLPNMLPNNTICGDTPASPSTMTPPRQPPPLNVPALISGRNPLQPVQLLYPACNDPADTAQPGEPPLKLRRLDDASSAPYTAKLLFRNTSDLGISDMWSDPTAIPVCEDTNLLADAAVNLRPSPLQRLPVYEDTQLLETGLNLQPVCEISSTSQQPPAMERHGRCGEPASADTTLCMSENLGSLRLGRHAPARHCSDSVNPSPMLFSVDAVQSNPDSSAALPVYEDTQLLPCPQVSSQPPPCSFEPLVVYEDTQLLPGPMHGSGMVAGHTGLDSICVYEDTQLLEPSRDVVPMTGLSGPPREYEVTEFMAENMAPRLDSSCSPPALHEVTRLMAENIAPAQGASRPLTLDVAHHCGADQLSRCEPLMVHEDTCFLGENLSTIQCASTDSSPTSVSEFEYACILVLCF